MKWKNFVRVNKVEGPELGFRKESMCWSGLRCWVYSRCSTFMLKKCIFSLFKNTEFPTSLDVFLSLFFSLRVFFLYLGEVPPRRRTKFPPTWSKFPRIGYIRKRMFSFIFMRLTQVLVLYTSLRLVEGAYKPQRGCVGWASVTKPCLEAFMWIKLTVWTKFPQEHPNRFGFYAKRFTEEASFYQSIWDFKNPRTNNFGFSVLLAVS